MPFVQIAMLQGRTEDQKRKVIGKVTDALIDTLGVARDTVRVMIADVPATNWGIGGLPFKEAKALREQRE
jgi:4-oxalocrotonate tautomerase